MKKILSTLLLGTIFFLLFNGCEDKNQAPSCEIIQPTEDAEFEIGEIINISADAEDPDREAVKDALNFIYASKLAVLAKR